MLANAGKVARKLVTPGTLLVVKWLGLCASTAVGLGLIPSRGTKILQASQQSKQNENNKQTCRHCWWQFELWKLIEKVRTV